MVDTGKSEQRKKTLIIDSSSSKCGNCGLSCSPHDSRHETVYGYGPQNGTPGCGIEWTHVGSSYMGSAPEEWCKRMRPDLIFVGVVF